MSSRSRNDNNKLYSFKSGNSFLSPFNPYKSAFNFINLKKKEKKNHSPINIEINDLNYIRSKKNIGQNNPKLLDTSKKNISYINSFKFDNSRNLSNSNIKNQNLEHKNRDNNYILNNKRAKSKTNLGEKILSYDYLKTEIPSVNIFQKAPRVKNIANLKILFCPKNNFQKCNSNYYDDIFGIGKNKKNINVDNNKKEKKEVRKGPEEMHWYFVKFIQEAKKIITKFDDL